MIRLGIDTGGTYTDAVVVDTDGMKVLAKAKALTTKENLARGIAEAVDGIPDDALAQVGHVALSTTLATNACVEGKGGHAKLVIVGTTPEILHRVDAQGRFGIPYEDVITTEYIGSFDGVTVEVPDWEALYESNPSFFEEADSFGIASLYALNNGAIVEKSGAEFLRERFGKFVVEAVTVAAEPNVIERGATALLNARLIPVIGDFLDAIDEAMAQRGLDVPVSIVRSDGTLMSEELARTRPVETILSGPAASVMGAQVLVGAPECLVVDVGGTTSDISIVHEGQPNRTDGIVIGGWKTQVAGVSIGTIALGGDTVVRCSADGGLALGTRRVLPLCTAAVRWPQVRQFLERYLREMRVDSDARFELLYLLRDPGDLERFREPDRRLVELLREGPQPLFDECTRIPGLRLSALEDAGIVMRSGFTPTDAMHLKGDFEEFDAEASRLGAQCLLKACRGKVAEADDPVAALADEVYELAQHRLFEQAFEAFSQDMLWDGEPFALDGQMRQLARLVWERRRDGGPHMFDVRFSGDARFVGIGAPTHVLLDAAAEALGVAASLPDHAEVANAIGAAASRVTVEAVVRVNPVRGSDGVIKGYKVCGSDRTISAESADEAVEAAKKLAREEAVEESRRRGADGDVSCTVRDNRIDYAATGVGGVVREWVVTALVK